MKYARVTSDEWVRRYLLTARRRLTVTGRPPGEFPYAALLLLAEELAERCGVVLDDTHGENRPRTLAAATPHAGEKEKT